MDSGSARNRSGVEEMACSEGRSVNWGGVCPESCGGLAGGSPVGVVTKQPVGVTYSSASSLLGVGWPDRLGFRPPMLFGLVYFLASTAPRSARCGVSLVWSRTVANLPGPSQAYPGAGHSGPQPRLRRCPTNSSLVFGLWTPGSTKFRIQLPQHRYHIRDIHTPV